jgi:pyruvate/2-oxoacid:ferredoxin oxidoreductase alpha subunit
MQGDCLELMKTIPNKSIDAIICDLPYGTTACKWDSVIPFEPLWAQYKRIIKDNGAIVLTAAQPFTSALVMSNPSLFKYEWIWNKQAAGNFTVSLFRVAEETKIPALTLLQQFTGETGINLDVSLAYYLNQIRSKATLLGVSTPVTPNFYAARNVVQ